MHVDLMFQGREGVIATAVVEGRDGLALVDPGPSSCLPALESGLVAAGHRLADVRTILLTHIHLDHAGATGTLVRRLAAARVFVHERGAPHLVDPSRLLASATRLYGERMDTLWGPVEPVPADRVRALSGGESLDVEGRGIDVAYTPGHATHHVSYLDTSEGTAYVGDTCGIRARHDFIVAPTPPPDIDIEHWQASLDIIERWGPAQLFLTHFGPVSGTGSHIQRLRETLRTSAAIARQTLDREGTDEDRARAFAERLRAEARRVLPEQDAAAVELSVGFEQLWQGLARYWRKRADAGA